jgi:hypothetical protein
VNRKISLLPPDRSKNIELVLNRLKMSATQLKHALFHIDFKVITSEKQDMLINAAPEKEEIDLYLQTS